MPLFYDAGAASLSALVFLAFSRGFRREAGRLALLIVGLALLWLAVVGAGTRAVVGNVGGAAPLLRISCGRARRKVTGLPESLRSHVVDQAL